MAGMRAALVYPHPLLLTNLPDVLDLLRSGPALNTQSWIDYEPSAAIKMIVQIIHRGTAYLLLTLSIFVFWQNRQRFVYSKPFIYFAIMLVVQMILGICTVSFSIGKVPIWWGAIHQIGAFILLASFLWLYFLSQIRKR